MHGLEVTPQEIDEGIEPLDGLHCFEQQEVVGVAEADVRLLMRQDGAAQVLDK